MTPSSLQQSVQVTLRQRATNVAFTPSSPTIVWNDAHVKLGPGMATCQLVDSHNMPERFANSSACKG